MKSTSRRAVAVLFGLGLVVLPLSSCGSDKKSTDSSAESAVAESAVAESAAADSTPASEAISSDASAETEASDTSESAETEAAGSATEAASEEPSGTDGVTQMKAMLAGMGLTDEKQIACITDKVKDLNDDTAASGAMISCAPEFMAEQAAGGITEQFPDVTKEQALCISKITFQTLADLPEDERAKTLATDDMPPEFKSKITPQAKKCGVSDAKLEEILNG
jgi:hypothetical protein